MLIDAMLILLIGAVILLLPLNGAYRTRLRRRLAKQSGATVPPEQLVEVLFSLYIDSLAQEHLGAWPDGPGRMIEDVIPAVLTGLSEPDPRSPL